MRMYAVYGLGGLRRRAVGSVNERLMFGVGWVKPTGIAARGFHPPYCNRSQTKIPTLMQVAMVTINVIQNMPRVNRSIFFA